MKITLRYFLLLSILCALSNRSSSASIEDCFAVTKPRYGLPRTEEVKIVTHGVTSNLKEMVLCSERGDKTGAVKMLKSAQQSLVSLHSFSQKMKDELRKEVDDAFLYVLALGKKQQALELAREKLVGQKTDLEKEKIWINAELEKIEAYYFSECNRIKNDTETKRSQVRGTANAVSAASTVSLALAFLGPAGWIAGGIITGVTITASQLVATAIEDVELIPKMKADLAKQQLALAAKKEKSDSKLTTVFTKMRRLEKVIVDASIVATQAEVRHQELRALMSTLEGASRGWTDVMALTENIGNNYSQVEKAIRRLGTRPSSSSRDIQLAVNKWAQIDNVLKCADLMVRGFDSAPITITMQSIDKIITRC